MSDLEHAPRLNSLTQPVKLNSSSQKPNKKSWKSLIAYLFLLPTILTILLFNYYPALAALFYSFTNWDGFTKPKFIGFDNFVEMFTSEVFTESFWNLLWLSLFFVITAIIVPLLTAHLIFKVKRRKLQYMYQLLFVFPLVVPQVVNLLLWQFILNPQVGLFNAVLSKLGVAEANLPLWLADSKTALVSLMLVGFPWVNGVAVLIFLAGLQNIPSSIIEAARVDGVSGWKLFVKIELPLVVSQIKLILVLTIIGALQSFQTQLVMTGGGPGYSTTVPGLVMYKEAIVNSRLGFGSAIGVVLFIVILGLTLINNKYLKSDTDYTPD